MVEDEEEEERWWWWVAMDDTIMILLEDAMLVELTYATNLHNQNMSYVWRVEKSNICGRGRTLLEYIKTTVTIFSVHVWLTVIIHEFLTRTSNGLWQSVANRFDRLNWICNWRRIRDSHKLKTANVMVRTLFQWFTLSSCIPQQYTKTIMDIQPSILALMTIWITTS